MSRLKKILRVIFIINFACVTLFLAACGNESGRSETSKTTVNLSLSNYRRYLIVRIVSVSTGYNALPTLYSLDVSCGSNTAIYEDVIIVYKCNDDISGAVDKEYTARLALTIGGIGKTPNYVTIPEIVNISGTVKY